MTPAPLARPNVVPAAPRVEAAVGVPRAHEPRAPEAIGWPLLLALGALEALLWLLANAPSWTEVRARLGAVVPTRAAAAAWLWGQVPSWDAILRELGDMRMLSEEEALQALRPGRRRAR